MHILVADDDEIFTMMIEGICKNLGHTCDVFTNGAEAIAQIDNSDIQYHAAILDVFMPGSNGDQIANELKRHYDGKFPILFCTGLADSSNWSKLQKLGNVMNKENAMTGLSYEIEKLAEWAMRLKNDLATRQQIMTRSNSNLYIKNLEHIANEARALLDIIDSQEVSISTSSSAAEERLTLGRRSLADSIDTLNSQL